MVVRIRRWKDEGIERENRDQDTARVSSRLALPFGKNIGLGKRALTLSGGKVLLAT